MISLKESCDIHHGDNFELRLGETVSVISFADALTIIIAFQLPRRV